MSSDTMDQDRFSPQKNQASDSGALAEEIKALARRGAFREAEALRERLLQTDPMGLAHIVSTAEVIEEEKTKNLDADHLALWNKLYEDLSQEEVNCLFYSLRQARVEPGKLLLAQGKPNNRLFLIDSGRVTVFYRKEKKNIPLFELTRGDILGEETFFGISFCSFSAATQSEVSLSYLNWEEVQAWHDSQPGLYEKCGNFCGTFGKCEEAVRQKNIEKRTYQRYGVAGVVTAYILDRQGNRTATYFRGVLTDISRTGLCFTMKCSKQETARFLLAKQLEVTIIFDAKKEKPLTLRGWIVKVSFHLHNDYSVHVKLGNLIAEELFKMFPCDWSANTENQ